MFEFLTKPLVWMYDIIVHGKLQSIKNYKNPWESHVIVRSKAVRQPNSAAWVAMNPPQLPRFNSSEIIVFASHKPYKQFEVSKDNNDLSIFATSDFKFSSKTDKEEVARLVQVLNDWLTFNT